MQNTPIYEALADAFVAEGVDTHFTLMVDGKIHWVSAMQKRPGRFNDLILDFLRRH
jgi:acetolactate synthase I/II/III large subunit